MTTPPAEYRVFLDAAEGLCQVVMSAAAGSDAARPSVNEVRIAVADTLAAGWRLPDVEPATDKPLPSTVSDDEWHSVFAGLSDWIGESEYYSTNQTIRGRGTRKVTTGSVSDDLADIWRDLDKYLKSHREATPWQDVVWQIRFDLRTHWGTHAVEVLRALHTI